MAKIFYDNLVMLEEVVTEIDIHDLTTKERAELILLVDQIIHQHTLDVILTHLPKEKHPHFLSKFTKAPHDSQLLTYLKTETTVDIELEITNRAKEVKKEIIEEIRKAKRK
ncbi:MAG: hypothetical protein UT63_C0012G0011 [Candidatus Gottesmanbacteria bacterium GW2011_GWC2_39_8]|uniref:Uncharacterized protein n=1 Tax=Candidatus Gottesmanbacteria bacterium GW2011_GWC2_39_8 TaxID=1618450 RepID=A0A0G0T7B5_9BACT|nr:MAG: hypothetical protein UT63_C0012G0011 [Candidatus Gottesmanbacteria bacterium GW2011_GWC2_39_8]